MVYFIDWINLESGQVNRVNPGLILWVIESKWVTRVKITTQSNSYFFLAPSLTHTTDRTTLSIHRGLFFYSHQRHCIAPQHSHRCNNYSSANKSTASAHSNPPAKTPTTQHNTQQINNVNASRKYAMLSSSPRHSAERQSQHLQQLQDQVASDLSTLFLVNGSPFCVIFPSYLPCSPWHQHQQHYYSHSNDKHLEQQHHIKLQQQQYNNIVSASNTSFASYIHNNSSNSSTKAIAISINTQEGHIVLVVCPHLQETQEIGRAHV